MYDCMTSAIVFFPPNKLIRVLHFFSTPFSDCSLKAPEGPVKLTSYYKLRLPFKDSRAIKHTTTTLATVDDRRHLHVQFPYGAY